MEAVIRVSFERVTHESAENGEAEETGWENEEGTSYTFREAVKLLRGTEPSGTWFHSDVWYTQIDYDGDPRTGDRKNLSYHIDADDRFKRRLFQAVTKGMIGIFR
jgi:hypothetical protein